MNKRPVYYSQKDPRWKDKPYRVPGEESTVGSAGCGPSCAAMLISTITGKTFTPEDACKWSVDHGYKALKQGTYYSYFQPQFAAFGINCGMLNWTNTYGRPSHANHQKALEMLKEGYYLIACMGPGNWTSTGHFIVVWWADSAMAASSGRAESNRAQALDAPAARSADGKIRINDPNSAREDRTNGDPYAFRSQVKYYWWVDARAYNDPPRPAEKEESMTGKEIYDALQAYLAEQPVPAWAEAELQEAIDMGVTDGKSPMRLIPRYQAAIMAKRAARG